MQFETRYYGTPPSAQQIQSLRDLPLRQKMLYAHLVRIRISGRFVTNLRFLQKRFRLPRGQLLASIHGLKTRKLIRRM